MSLAAIQVGMKDLQEMIVSFGPEISICIRGRHAVGKSEGAYQSASRIFHDFYKEPSNQARYGWTYEQGLPVVERRLSQLTEGDLTGMPSLDSERKSTSYKPCDWIIDACERPVFLFLDERNRALEGVKQAVFQIMDSRTFYGYKLHPGTRVVVAENVGDLYNVQQCDPAEVSRAATVELCPTVQEFIDYASGPGKCHPMFVDFIRGNQNFLEFDPDDASKAKRVYEANKKYPDRRSWFKLAHQLDKCGLMDNPDHTMFYIMTASMVGTEAAIKFTDFCKNYDRQISLKDVLTNWPAAKAKLGTHFTAAKSLEIQKKLEVFFKKETLTEPQARQLGMFMHDCPSEPRMAIFASLQVSRPNLFAMLPFIDDLMTRTATGEDTSKKSVPGKK